jgi:hypothetical protein
MARREACCKPFLTWLAEVLLFVMNSKQRKTRAAIFSDPMPKTLPWDDIESLLKAIGCRVIEKGGSAVAFEKNGHMMHAHRPHPHNTVKLYVIKGARDFLDTIGEAP